jgi:hypothetical protein
MVWVRHGRHQPIESGGQGCAAACRFAFMSWRDPALDGIRETLSSLAAR